MRLAEEAALGRVEGEGEKVRRYGEFRYAAKTWSVERRVIARVEASERVLPRVSRGRLRQPTDLSRNRPEPDSAVPNLLILPQLPATELRSD
jgi:hypothetical protein